MENTPVLENTKILIPGSKRDQLVFKHSFDTNNKKEHWIKFPFYTESFSSFIQVEVTTNHQNFHRGM